MSAVKSKSRKSETQRERDQRLANVANDVATRNGEIAFGARVTRDQINACERVLKSKTQKQVLDSLKLDSLAQLRKLASNELSTRSVSREARSAANERQIAVCLLISDDDAYRANVCNANHFWVRKLYACAFAIASEYKRSSKRSK